MCITCFTKLAVPYTMIIVNLALVVRNGRTYMAARGTTIQPEVLLDVRDEKRKRHGSAPKTSVSGK